MFGLFGGMGELQLVSSRFFFLNIANYTGLPSMGADPNRERPPPADPAPLDFPVYDLPENKEKDAESALKNLYNVLASIRRPQDLTAERFEPFNLKVEENVPVSRIVRHDVTSSVPPRPWDDVPGEKEDRPPALMENENRYPDKERYQVLRNELLLNNEDAFREVARIPPPEGRQRVRITQTRKFWTGFERMAQYWDTSIDNYFERPATPEQTPEEEKRDKMQTDEDSNTSASNDQDTPMTLDHPSNTHSNGHGLSSPQPQSQPQPPRSSVVRYTGRRIGSGPQMPEDIRDEAIRAFVEMAAWPFGCQVNVPMLPPRLTVKKLLFPIRLSFEAARSPKDRALARRGILEGPILVGQCRPETTFRNSEERPGSGMGEVCDLFREVGAMLLGAQERAREGATEVRPGEGQWWTTVPRWGGSPNVGVVDSEQDETNAKSEIENPSKRSKYDHPFLATRRLGRKLSNAEKWKVVEPGPSLWDKRMRYMQIGKSKESPFDDVCLPMTFTIHAGKQLTQTRSTCYHPSTTILQFSIYESTVDISRLSRQETVTRRPNRTHQTSHGMS